MIRSLRLTSFYLLPLISACVGPSSHLQRRANADVLHNSASSFTYGPEHMAPQIDRIKAAPSRAELESYPAQHYVWNGADQIDLSTPATIIFEKSDMPFLEMRAPARLLKALAVSKGQIRRLNARPQRDGHPPLTLIIHAPAVPPLMVNSAAFIFLENIHQDTLDIEMTGAGSLHATGQVQQLKLTVRGNILGDLSQLHAQDIHADAHDKAKIHLRGKGSVHLCIANTAMIRLYSRPNILITRLQIFGKFYQNY